MWSRASNSKGRFIKKKIRASNSKCDVILCNFSLLPENSAFSCSGPSIYVSQYQSTNLDKRVAKNIFFSFLKAKYSYVAFILRTQYFMLQFFPYLLLLSRVWEKGLHLVHKARKNHKIIINRWVSLWTISNQKEDHKIC